MTMVLVTFPERKVTLAESRSNYKSLNGTTPS